MSKPYFIWLKLVVVLAAFYLLSKVTPIYLPIILAIVFAFIINPLASRLARLRAGSRFLMPHGLAVALAIAVAIGVLTAVISFIFSPFVSEFNRLIVNLPALIQKIQALTGRLEEQANSISLPANIRLIIDQILSSAASYAVTLGRRVLGATVGFASKVVELVVVPVLTYYFLKDWRALKSSAIEALPPDWRDRGRVIIEEMGATVSGYIRGQAVVSVLMGFLAFVGMYFLGVDYPLVFGLLAALTETIPIVGPIIGAAPAVFLAYLATPELAAKVIIFFLVIHQLENHIIVPKIMGKSIDLHPVTVIISLLIGGQLMGVVGMILAVPAAALLKVLYRHLWRYE
ncbi:AI-2E family transporter [Anaeroselena agilis]|uniref:AI-2E family transporter n=1 Tax=Anaeroselena agilis TaxID=3063788 RepID=A0ABU3NW32_9FIRM|nr:AI-2E family transporter [Selenomonadales bacterium 4137-cl]